MHRALLLKQTVLKIGLLIVGAAIILAIPIQLPAKIGAIDFRPYWSSSFLLAQGQDFSDPSRMEHVERTLTGWQKPFTMYAWFAPTGNLVLLPYTLLPFQRASYYWLLTNIAAVFISALLLWRNMTSRVWIPLVTTFGFSMTLLSFICGQVNTLVLLGLALYLFLSDLRRDYAAGASLALTTIKPHLVILTLPLLLIDAIRRKQWRVFVGFVGTLMVCAVILFVLYPAWPISFWQLIATGMGSARETPTIPGLLVVAGDRLWGKWIWVVVLTVAIIIWWKHGKDLDRRSLMDVTILAGLMIAPVGWSYDQIMLLFPILRVLEWVAKGSLARKDAITVVLILFIANAITFYERVLTPSEIWYIWVPPVIAAVYVFAWQRKQARLMALVSDTIWHDVQSTLSSKGV